MGNADADTVSSIAVYYSPKRGKSEIHKFKKWNYIYQTIEFVQPCLWKVYLTEKKYYSDWQHVYRYEDCLTS